MCGIIGYTGQRLAVPLLINGLRLLEYRGYDSAGIAILGASGTIQVIRKADPVHQKAVEIVAGMMAEIEPTAQVGLGHTRWATHGPRIDINAHPHCDCHHQIAVAHNGQISNHQALRQGLLAGHAFSSTTDTEVIPHLLEHFLAQPGTDLVTAVRFTAKLLEGAFAFVVYSALDPTTLIGARQGSELCIGVSDDGRFLSSDEEAFLAVTKRHIDLNDGEVAIITPDSHRIVTFNDDEVMAKIQESQLVLEQIEKGDYSSFMEKEIHEQPDVINRVFEGRVTTDGLVRLGGIERRPDLQRFIREELSEVLILGCGTSLYAGMMIERYLQELGFRARACDAAEFTTGPSPLHTGTLVIPISQSGETRDLLDAMEVVRAEKCWTFALCNKPGTALTKFGPGVYLQAGPEKGVASTKAFVAQVLAGWLVSLNLGSLRGYVNTLAISGVAEQTRALSVLAQQILAGTPSYIELGASFRDVNRMLYIGRGYNLPLAMEGALKMMEITQIPALGMSAAAMKHGPIALVDPKTVIVAVCLPDPHHPDVIERSIDNVNQVVSAAGRVIVLTTTGLRDRFTAIDHGEHRVERVLTVPDNLVSLTTAVAVIPLQLMALGTAQARGLNVDKPRNLAKAVTVT